MFMGLRVPNVQYTFGVQKPTQLKNGFEQRLQNKTISFIADTFDWLLITSDYGV